MTDPDLQSVIETMAPEKEGGVHAQWDDFTDPKTEIEAAAKAVRDAHWQIARVRRFVYAGTIAGGSETSRMLSGLETRTANVAVELEKLERRVCG